MAKNRRKIILFVAIALFSIVAIGAVVSLTRSEKESDNVEIERIEFDRERITF